MTPYLPSFFYSNSGMLQETDFKEDNIPQISTHTYNPDEIAVRFKYRIMSIHCFPNGNGRHSRLMADIIIEKVFGPSHNLVE